MNAEFNWWLLIVGLGAGAAITWLVLSDLSRRDDDLSQQERDRELAWLVDDLAMSGEPIPAETVARVLEAHRGYVARDPDGRSASDEDELSEVLADDAAVAAAEAQAEAEAGNEAGAGAGAGARAEVGAEAEQETGGQADVAAATADGTRPTDRRSDPPAGSRSEAVDPT